MFNIIIRNLRDFSRDRVIDFAIMLIELVEPHKSRNLASRLKKLANEYEPDLDELLYP